MSLIKCMTFAHHYDIIQNIIHCPLPTPKFYVLCSFPYPPQKQEGNFLQYLLWESVQTPRGYKPQNNMPRFVSRPHIGWIPLELITLVHDEHLSNMSITARFSLPCSRFPGGFHCRLSGLMSRDYCTCLPVSPSSGSVVVLCLPHS